MSRPPFGSALSIFGLNIPWYSLLMMIAVALGLFLAMREEKRLRLPKDTVLNYALLAVPLGIIGARLYYVAFSFDKFSSDLWEIFRLWHGGLAIYGAVLGGAVAALIVTRGNLTHFLTLADICAPSLVLGQALGRWGNYANMEAYGARVTASWAQFFPLAVEIPTVMADGTTYWYWHMATFFYESLCCALIFVFLWRFKKKATRCGDVFFFYLLLYCAERTIIEGLRDDSLTITVSGGQVRFSQVLSTVVLLLVAIIFFRRLCARKRPRTADYMAWGAIALGIACTYVGEFERNAYQGLFPVAQFLLALLLLLDGAFLFHYTRNMRRIDKPVRFTGAAALLALLVLLCGIGRMGASNTVYVTLRQAVAIGHATLAVGWFYLRATPRRRARRTPQPIPNSEA